MSYMNKRLIENIVMDAFNAGVIEGLSMDSHIDTPETIMNSLDFEEFYQRHFKKEEDV